MATATKKIIATFKQNVKAPMHLTSHFAVDSNSYFNTEEIEYHVARDSEDVATPMAGSAQGYNINDENAYTAKTTTPPTYKEEIAIPASSVGKVQGFGINPYQDEGFLAEVTRRAMAASEKLMGKIRRACELQASQIFTTGKLSLVDKTGAVTYALDYKPKAAHFFTTSVPWSTTASADPLADILAACRLIRKDSLEDPKVVEMDADSFEAAMKVTSFKDRFELRRADLGTLYPLRGIGTRGAEYRGTIDVGAYKLDIYTYEAYYKHPQTGTQTLYLPRKKVVVHTGSDMKAAFGALFNYNQTKAPIPFLRSRMMIEDMGVDLFLNNWLDANGEVLHIGVGCRPLMVPVLLDTIACIDSDLA